MLSFDTMIRQWMRLIRLPMNEQRELFLRLYRSLLIMRRVEPDHRCLAVAMEVFLNLSRHHVRQQRYLRALNARLGRELAAAATCPHIHYESDGLLWDIPGHLERGDGFHLAMVQDDPPAVLPAAPPARVMPAE